MRNFKELTLCGNYKIFQFPSQNKFPSVIKFCGEGITSVARDLSIMLGETEVNYVPPL